MTCTSGADFYIGLNTGVHGNGSYYNWNMQAAGGAQLNYAMFRDAAHTQIWGGANGFDTINGTGTGLPQSITFYGLIPAASATVPGSYTDTITMTVGTTFPMTTANLSVSATLTAFCSVAAGNLAFGTYTGVALNATATLTATCSNTTAYQININAGSHWQGGDFYTATMVGPSSGLLDYRMWQDAAHTILWGNTLNFDSYNGTGNGVAQSIPLYAQVFGGQAPAPGSYSDTVTVTITY